jgi:hypothetical protein
MKKTAIILLLLLCAAQRLPAQTAEVRQLLLNVEKLAQLRQVLSDMKQGYQVLSTGYSAIREVARGNFQLHQGYLDGLLQVSPAVRRYHRVAGIVQQQGLLVAEYKRAYRLYRESGSFSPQELAYLGRVYERLFRLSLDHLEALTRVMSDGQLRMSDDERLQAIDAIHRDMEEALLFLRRFNQGATLLALQRAKERQDIAVIRRIHGLTD